MEIAIKLKGLEQKKMSHITEIKEGWKTVLLVDRENKIFNYNKDDIEHIKVEKVI